MYNIEKQSWYILQTFSGFENRIVETIQSKIKNYDIKILFTEIMVPGENVIEFKSGKKKNIECKFFPGYILIKMHMNEKIWKFIKKIPKVIGFIGGVSERPAALSNQEIEKIIYQISKIGKTPRSKIKFSIGEKIRIKNGPFADFYGKVEEVDYIKNRLKISVLIFGRSTPIELNFVQVEQNN